jgi:hypothetical protein
MTTEWRLDRLAKARAAKLNPPNAKALRAQHAIWEAARIADLYEDEKANPANYCARVAPMPTDGVCTHCQAVNALVHKSDHYGSYLACVHCGSDYFPDSEPVPVISYKGGRHTNGEKVGDHHMTYDDQYRKTRRENAKA